MAGGLCPAFADCGVDARPAPAVRYYVRRRLGIGAGAWGRPVAPPVGRLYETALYAFPNSASEAEPARARWKSDGVRTWFEAAGLLIARPPRGRACRLAVALKGGHNGEHHNHNDVGSYIAAVDGAAVLADPGAEVYTARTFGPKRYASNVLNSFGHPVPRVAGRLQRTGAKARAKVLGTEFTAEADTLALDIRPAYAVPSIETLHRTFVYSRKGAGSLTVRDEIVLAAPETFETALITFGHWKRRGPGALEIRDGERGVRVRLAVDGGPFDVAAEEIHEDVRAGRPPTRIAVRLARPVKKAAVTATITPL
jgi:hypothetical protein